MYPSDKIPLLLDHFDGTDGGGGSRQQPVDLLLRDFLEEAGTESKGYLAEGDFFRHLGYYSSLHSKHKTPRDFYNT